MAYVLVGEEVAASFASRQARCKGMRTARFNAHLLLWPVTTSDAEKRGTALFWMVVGALWGHGKNPGHWRSGL